MCLAESSVVPDASLWGMMSREAVWDTEDEGQMENLCTFFLLSFAETQNASKSFSRPRRNKQSTLGCVLALGSRAKELVRRENRDQNREVQVTLQPVSEPQAQAYPLKEGR